MFDWGILPNKFIPVCPIYFDCFGLAVEKMLQFACYSLDGRLDFSKRLVFCYAGLKSKNWAFNWTWPKILCG